LWPLQRNGLLDEHLGHCPVLPESPRLPYSDFASSGGRLDVPPGAMSRKTDHGIPNMGAGATGLAGGV
jgi:hypothetical protein